MKLKKQNSWICLLLMFTCPAAHAQQDLINRLIQIKYTTELYVGNALKKSEQTHNTESRDSALAIYNTIRYKVDGLVYSLSADMIAHNSPRKLRLLNEWSWQAERKAPIKKCIRVYVQQIKNIETLFQQNIAMPLTQNEKTVNLSTNVFYLLKDSYTIIQGLSDMKTKQTMALVELLDHTRLLGPGEVGKMGSLK